VHGSGKPSGRSGKQHQEIYTLNPFGNRRFTFFAIVAAFLLSGFAQAEVWLPSIFSDHMVLQRAARVPIWGKASPGESISVNLNGRTIKGKAGIDGRWQIDLDLRHSPIGPFEMVVQGNNTVRIDDVVVGEVWLGSGQSNAGLEMSKMIHRAEEVATAKNSMHREFMAISAPSLFEEQDDVPGFWRMVEPGSTKDFSAVGYFFIKSIHEVLNTPVGYINNCWGGVRLDRYLSSEAISSVPRLAAQLETEKQHTIESFEALRDWLKETGREDREPNNLEAFTKGPLTPSNGWEPARWIDRKDIAIAGREPENGVFWIATEVNCTTSEWPSPQRLLLCNNGLFEKVYWNGHLIGETSYHNYIGTGTRWHYYIPPEIVKEGVNHLAIRIYAPIDPPGFGWWPGLNGKRLDWRMKKEFGLPPVADVRQPPRLRARNIGTGSLFNGMLRPIIPYAIRGAVWYQGEANARSALEYREELPLLINDWRKRWKMSEMPFYYCQLPQFRAKEDNPGLKSEWAELREAQLMTLSISGTGMAVLIDTGESEDIHPLAKDVAGERLARIALAKVYGKSIPYSGPIYSSMRVEGNHVRLDFRYAEGGLVARELPAEYDVSRTRGTTAPLIRNRPGSELEGFEICGADQQWVWADARIEGEAVIVWSDRVVSPAAVRYAWADNPTGNLYNKAGLPASPFRTDDFQ